MKIQRVAGTYPVTPFTLTQPCWGFTVLGPITADCTWSHDGGPDQPLVQKKETSGRQPWTDITIKNTNAASGGSPLITSNVQPTFQNFWIAIAENQEEVSELPDPTVIQPMAINPPDNSFFHFSTETTNNDGTPIATLFLDPGYNRATFDFSIQNKLNADIAIVIQFSDIVGAFNFDETVPELSVINYHFVMGAGGPVITVVSPSTLAAVETYISIPRRVIPNNGLALTIIAPHTGSVDLKVAGHASEF